MNDVFVQGESGYARYRIPALLQARDNTLLAFCEARRFHSDHAENKIVLKQSFDNGSSWTDMQLIADAGKNSLNNPLVVQDAVERTILLMYQEYPATADDAVADAEQWRSHAGQDFPPNVHEAAVEEGYEGRVCRTFLQRSQDNGATWGHAEEVTRQVKRPTKVTSNAGGPGAGIQLTGERYRHRIVLPFTQGPWDAMKAYAVYSDDHGRTWHMGDVAPAIDDEFANEAQVAELDDGRLLLNARSYKGNKYRKLALSSDGGESWAPLADACDLPEPECQGSMIRVCAAGEHASRLIYCGPDDVNARRHGTLKQSTDRGASWSLISTVYDGSFAYSAMCQLDSDTVGVLFERDDYERISFRAIDIGQGWPDPRALV